MKKLFALLLALSLLLCGCAGQAGDNGNDGNAQLPPLNMAELYGKLVEAGLAEDSMVDVPEAMLLNLYGIESADVKQAKVTISNDGLKADEVWLIEATDAEAAQRIKTLAENRIQQKDDESITYSPEQNAVVKKSYLAVEGNYVIFLCHPDVDSLKVAVAAALGK